MIRRLALTVAAALALGGCEKKETGTAGEKPIAPAPTAVPPPTTTLPKGLQPLLKTDRVRVMAGGVSWDEARIATEIDATLADIRTLPPSAARDRALASVLGVFATTDPRRAADLLAAWDDARISFWLQAAAKVLAELAKTDREAAADFIVTHVPASAQASAWEELLWRLPPADQVALLDRIPRSTAKKQIVTELVHAWTDADPAASAAWLDTFIQGLSPDDLRALQQRRRFMGGIPTDPQPLLAAARAAVTPEARTFFAEVGWKRLQGKADPELVTRFAEFLPEMAAREQERQMNDDPAGFAAGLLPATVAAMPAETRTRLIEHWAESHPADALDWATKHELPEAALALRSLYLQDPAAAAKLAKTAPKGEALDAALSHLTHMIALRGDPSAAKDLLPLFSNEQKRSAAEKNIESTGTAR
jgi:hypothetical protein